MTNLTNTGFTARATTTQEQELMLEWRNEMIAEEKLNVRMEHDEFQNELDYE